MILTKEVEARQQEREAIRKKIATAAAYPEIEILDDCWACDIEPGSGW